MLARGTPVAQCFPVPRVTLDLACEPFDAGRRAAYEKTARDLLGTPGVYRKRFRAGRGPTRPDGTSSSETAPERREVEP